MIVDNPDRDASDRPECENCERVQELLSRMRLMEEASGCIVDKLQQSVNNITGILEKIMIHKSDPRVVDRLLRKIAIEVGMNEQAKEDELDEIHSDLRRKELLSGG